MGVNASQLIIFLASAGISMAALKLFLGSILMSLTLILITILIRGNHRSWSITQIDTGEYFARIMALIFILIMIVYIVQ